MNGSRPIRPWSQACRSTKVGSFLGTDPNAFPRDFAVLFRFGEESSRVRGRQPMPARMMWSEVEESTKGAEGVELIGERI
ncbi:hypothetical protein [Nocardiopsis alkaliphila]|uniref:hypothetical protein n=1 Tax=Nocardiopsis alkaliphila TaxID=225762 RepID=UPI000372A672|nr:hypothetical protein [Nocardiopsis alkaliphila]